MAGRNLGAGGHESHFEDRAAENQNKLRALDAMSRYDVRDKEVDLRAKKDAFDQEFKLSEQKRKMDATEERIGIAKERNDLTERQRATSEQLAALSQKEADVKISSMQAAIAAKMHLLDATEKVTTQTPKMYEEMEKMRDANGVVSPANLSRLNVLFPDAAAHENNSKQLTHERNRWDFVQDNAAKANAAAEAERRKLAGEKTVKTTDANGNVVTVRQPLKPGEGDTLALQAQHDAIVKSIGDNGWNSTNSAKIQQLNDVKAKLGYVPVDVPGVTDVLKPATMQPPALPVTQSSAAGVTPPVTPPTVTAQAAPAGDPGPDHSAAIDWAKANPDDPRAAAIRARNGL